PAVEKSELGAQLLQPLTARRRPLERDAFDRVAAREQRANQAPLSRVDQVLAWIVLRSEFERRDADAEGQVTAQGESLPRPFTSSGQAIAGELHRVAAWTIFPHHRQPTVAYEDRLVLLVRPVRQRTTQRIRHLRHA